MSGITGTQTELLYSLPAPVTKNTYTTQAVISALAASAPVARVPGGFFQENPNPIGRSLYLKALGTIANAATGYTFSPALGLDSTAGTPANTTTIYAATAPTASTTCLWDMEAWITCTAFGETAGMTWQVNGAWHQTPGASGVALSAAALESQFNATVTGLTPSTTYYVELCGTWSSSSASATTTVQQLLLWGLN